MAEIGIGIVGGGYMGKAHAAAFAAVGPIFETRLRPRLEIVAAASAESAERYRAAYGFARATADWRALVADERVEAVVIASPQSTHLEIATAALALDKPVLCEKPMGRTLEEGRAILAAAEAAGVPHMVGYNYIRTPASQQARALIAEGVIGRITHLSAEHNEDFMWGPGLGAWRLEGQANGCLGDLAPHVFNAVLALAGPIEELVARIETVVPEKDGVPVRNDDLVQMLVRFESGASGQVTASRVATGRKMGYAYEIFGTKGAIRFDQEDQNALWLYEGSDPPDRAGFRKILSGPAHPDYLPFCQGPGHGTGYQDQIVIEAHDFLKAIEAGQPRWPSFADGVAVHEIVAAARRSHETRAWTRLSDIRGET